MTDAYKHRCVRCGHTCRMSLFATSEGCTNPICSFFDAEARAIIDELEIANERVREAFRRAGSPL